MSGLIATSGRVQSMTSSSTKVVENYFPSGKIESHVAPRSTGNGTASLSAGMKPARYSPKLSTGMG